MNSWKARLAVLLVVVGLISACAAPATESPSLPPTEAAATATEAPTNVPAATDTSAPVAESSPTAETVAAGTTVSFSADILPLLQSRCLNCHGGNRTEEGLSLRTYEAVIAGSEGGAVIVPGDAAHSDLYELVATQKMPKRGPKLTPDQVQLIETWINEGALNN